MKGPLNYCFEIFVYLKLVLRFCLLYLALNIFYFNIVKNLFNYVQLDIFLCLPTNPCLPTFLSSYLPVLNQPMSSYQPILTFLSLPSYPYLPIPTYPAIPYYLAITNNPSLPTYLPTKLNVVVTRRLCDQTSSRQSSSLIAFLTGSN